MRWLLPLVFTMFAGCSSVAVPRTIALEAGTGMRHEVGEPAIQTNTVIVRMQWELRK